MRFTRYGRVSYPFVLLGFALLSNWLTLNFSNVAYARPPDDKTKALVEKIQAKAKEDRQSEVDQQLDQTTMTVEFDAVRLADVLDFLSDKLKVDIHLARVSQPQSETPITLRLKNRAVSVRTILDLSLDQLETPTGYIIRDGVLLITSQAQAQVTRIHDCQDLIEAAKNRRNPNPNIEKTAETTTNPSKSGGVKSLPKESVRVQAADGTPTTPAIHDMQFSENGTGNSDIRSLINLIQNIVQPESWTATGGPGSIERYYDRLIIVKQTPQAQQEIKELLDMIRAKEFGPTLQGN